MAVGITTLKALKDPAMYPTLEDKGAFLENGIRDIASRLGVPLKVNRVGSMFSCFFTNDPVVDAATARKASISIFKNFFHKLLEAGVYMAPSPFEAGFISAAHS